MSFDQILSSTNISASGLSAERVRMEVVANNIANAHATRTSGGGAFRRQDVVFATMLNDQLRSAGSRARCGRAGYGVQVVGIIDDLSEQPRVFNPGHPDADGGGFVVMPNVLIPLEMVNLMTANRAYEANVKVLQAFRQQTEQALSILRG
jgi:flagellar basal-body rod protein FlgC